MENWQRFIFLRHGQTDWNLQGRYQGLSDIALNATGLEQAEAAARLLKQISIDRIVSSPLVRALKTAAIVSEYISVPINVSTGMSERSFGSFDGLVINEVKRKHGLKPDEPSSKIFPPDAEKWPQTLNRSRDVVGKWLNDFPDETILFVAHDGIFRALSELLHGEWFVSSHGIPYVFEPGLENWTITEIS